MKKFILLYMAPISAEEQMKNASPEDMKKGMAPWMAWFQKAGSAIVDGGAPLGMGMNVTQAGSSKGQSHVAGYSIVQANDMETVMAMLKDHPHFMMPGASIEVLEAMPMSM